MKYALLLSMAITSCGFFDEGEKKAVGVEAPGGPAADMPPKPEATFPDGVDRRPMAPTHRTCCDCCKCGDEKK